MLWAAGLFLKWVTGEGLAVVRGVAEPLADLWALVSDSHFQVLLKCGVGPFCEGVYKSLCKFSKEWQGSPSQELSGFWPVEAAELPNRMNQMKARQCYGYIKTSTVSNAYPV